MGELGDLLAMLASAALQKRATDKAGDRAKQAAQLAQQRQLLAQDEASRAAAARAAQYQPDTRRQAQEQVEQQLTQQYDQRAQAPQVTAQGVQIGATLPEGKGTTEYLTAKAKEQAKALASTRALAALMGRIGGAGELRRNEAVGMGDTAGEIGRIQSRAGMQAGLDGPAIQQAGTISAGPMLAADALRGYGMSGLAKSGLKPAGSWLGG